MVNSDTSGNNFTPSTPSSQNPPSTPFAQHPSSQFTPYLYQNPSQFQSQFQSQTPPPFTMSQGDPSYGQYQSLFTLSQAFSPYYQPYPLTQPQAAAPQKDKGKGRKKTAPAKQRPIVQVSEDAEFLNKTDDAGMHWTDTEFTWLARAWVTTSVNVNGRTKGFTFYQKVNIAFNRDSECPTRRSCGSTKSQWYALNAQCVAYKGIVVQERFRNNSGKIEKDRENDAHKIYKGLNDGNDFKHRETITSDNSSPGNSVGSNNLSEDPDGLPIPQSAGPNSDLDGSLYEGGSRPIGQKLHRKHIASQKTMEGVTASGSSIQTLLDELRLEKMQANQEKERRRAEAIQHWQAKMDLEQAKEDCKIMEKDLSTLSGHQLQYYLQRQAKIIERMANKGGPGTLIGDEM
ncbi:hypothetical protein GIB67_025255 [Kingdonia uniflora]|uniref:No apical meristem-associated C-terminal domain-containing protein n=1 Tax=Kingdonia uniflora TaxID=39325 RepID=A0A7J7NAZ2_9MAGN|nr:hypothetical protein GIB67_025255 [Kingdonia uniflora]